MNLLEKYRPDRLEGLVGQEPIVDQLRSFLAAPYSAAFIFDGPTGTGKTTAALALAAELGVVVEEEEFGGLWQVASGEQTGETVRERLKAMRARPFMGSGWKVLIVNEADAMTPNAAYVWLDGLEHLPERCVIIFTTNHAGKLPRRFLDRCERCSFEGSALLLRPAAQRMIDRIWRAEGGVDDPPRLEDLRVIDENGAISFRRILQTLAPLLRGKLRPVAEAPAPPGDFDELARRFAAGARFGDLVRESGIKKDRLYRELKKRGVVKPRTPAVA